MSTPQSIPVTMFGDRRFAELNKEQFDQYVEYKVNGYHSHVAFQRVFGDEYTNPHLRIEFTEHNPYYRDRFKARLAEIKVDELWNTKTSLNELLAMARNPFAKDSTRLNAMKELNIMVGIVVVDENGKTKAGRSLDDFYNEQKG